MAGLTRTFALAAVLSATASLAAAQIMVVRAQGSAAAIYPPGTLLPANKALQLKAGDRLTVLDGGGTRQFTGPGRFLPQQPSRQAKSALTALIARDRPAVTRIGAARSLTLHSAASEAAGPAKPTNIWQIDVASRGNFCVATGQSVALWRAHTDAAAVVITRMANNSRRTLTWAAGNRSLDWPTDLPLGDGEEYVVSSTDGLDAGVVWRVVDPPSDDWTAFATQLARKGCYAQLDTVQASSGAPESP